MKLLLVNPNFEGVVVVSSLGLGFLATYIKDRTDCKVEVIEPILQGLTESQVLDKVRGSDILGLVCYTESRFQCFDFAKRAKMINPSCRIIVGGPHVNTLDREILNHYPWVDVVVRSEGEQTLLEIVKGKSLEEIRGISFRRDGTPIRNPDRELIKDIDRLDLDYSLYHPWIGTWKDYEVPPHLKNTRHLPIIASRGCPFRCTFCAAPKQWGGISRAIEPERLVKWLRYLVNRYNVGYSRFYDSLFTGNKERILEFCNLLEKEDLNITFRIDIRAGEDRYVLKRLKKVGCEVVGFGAESGSDRVLKRIDKGIKRKVTEDTIKICRELGFWLIGFFMVSLPDERMPDIRKTFELFKYFDVLNVQFFKVYPNTTSYDELKLRREIDDRGWFNQSYGFDTDWGSQAFYCKEIFPSSNFYHEEVNLIMSYSLEIHKLNKILKTSKSIRDFPLLFRLLGIKLILKSKGILRLYLRLKDTYPIRATKVFLRYIKICH